MVNRFIPRTTTLAHRLWVIALALWLAAAGLLANTGSVHAATLTITPSGGSDPARVGSAWSRTYTISGGTAPYSCSVRGQLPPGLSLSGCTVSGTPTDFGTYNFTIDAQDDASPKNTGSLSQSVRVVASTVTNLTLTSVHPSGPYNYMVGYAIYANVSVFYSPAIPGKVPSGTVSLTVYGGGPTCSITLDASGAGKCVLFITSAGSPYIDASYPTNGDTLGSSYAHNYSVAALSVTPAISATRNHTCYQASNGTTNCWGLNDGYPLAAEANLKAVSAGGYHTCGLKTDGTIACWGDNTDVTGAIPAGRYLELSAGDEHVCAIDLDNQLHCWGNMSAALLAVPTDKVKSVSAGVGFDCAIKTADSKPVCWGSLTSATNAAFTSVSVGTTHACGVRTTGALSCWGSPALTPPAGTYTAVSSGTNYSCAQAASGNLSCWGTTPPAVETGTSFAGFDSGNLHTCALKNMGEGVYTLSCWGDNSYGKAPALSLSPTSIQSYMTAGKSFSQTFAAAGGFAPYTIFQVSGSMPPGLSMTDGTLAGTLTTPGSYTFTLGVSESFPGSGLPLRLTTAHRYFTTTVINGATTTTLNLPASVDAGSPALASVTVSRVPSLPAISGTVTVASSDGDSTCQADVAADGTASCTLYFSTAVPKTVTATYSGDENYYASSGGDNISVNPVVINPAVGAGDQFSCSIDGDGKLSCWGFNDSYQTSLPPSGVFDQFDLGMRHGCALSLNRTVRCWGWNGYNIATPPAHYWTKKVTAGSEHSCMLSGFGTVSCWGNSVGNRLSVPADIFIDVDAGADHTCGVNLIGAVRCWGSNASAQSVVPAGVGLSTVARVSAGGNNSCALHSSGAVDCWGGMGTTSPAGTFSAVSTGGNFACGLKTDGTISCWGGLTTAPSGTFTQLSAGSDHACALRAGSGRMTCWGGNAAGQAPVMTLGPESLTGGNVNLPWGAALSAGGGRVDQYAYSIASGALPEGVTLTSTTGALGGTPTQAGVFNFSVLAQESSRTPALDATRAYSLTVRGLVDAKIDSVTPTGVMVGQPVRVSFSVHAKAGYGMGVEPTGTVTVTAPGNTCSVALVNGVGSCLMTFSEPGDKTVTISYPGDTLYQAGNNAAALTTYAVLPFSQPASLVTGADRTYVYHPDGTVGCIGSTCADDPFRAGIFTRLGAGSAYACGLKPDGSVLCESIGGAPALAFNNGRYMDLSVGGQHVCALRIDGTAECQGENGLGQASAPAGTFAALSAGGGHTCALRADGTAACWGNIATPPAGAFTRLTSGMGHTCGLQASGAALCWGDDSAGQSTVPASPASFTRLSAGGSQTCGLDAKGDAHCWGDDTFGQSAAPFGSFIAIATDENHTCALRENDQISCWGGDEAGEAPQYSFNTIPVNSLPALDYYEHVFEITGGTKPLSVSVEGDLPPEMNARVNEPEDQETANSGVVNSISPAGLILYGTPNWPGVYSFILRWQDVSPFPLVMQQPYTLTITGGDLAITLSPLSPADALEGMTYSFKAVVTNQTDLPVPEVLVRVPVPAGLTDLTADIPGCEVTDGVLTCPLGEVQPGELRTVWFSGTVSATKGAIIDIAAGVDTLNPAWPEIDPGDNAAAFSVKVALKAEVINEDFDTPPFPGWTGGTPTTEPNGQTLLTGGNDSIRLDFSDLPGHKYVIVRVELYVIGDWLGNNEGGLPSRWSFGQFGLTPILDTSFCNLADCPQAYPGQLPGGAYPARTGADGKDELGRSETDTRYSLYFKIPHAGEDLSLLFSGADLPAGALWGLDRVTVEVDSGNTRTFLPMTSK